MIVELSGVYSIGFGDTDLGGSGRGLLGSFVSMGEVGETGFIDSIGGKVGSAGNDDKLSNDTVCGTFCFTSLPWREGGTRGRFRPTFGDGCTSP